MVDVAKRGAELVLADQFCLLAADAKKLADIFKERPDELGLTRIADFMTVFHESADEINEVAMAYVAAERIRGRK